MKTKAAKLFGTEQDTKLGDQMGFVCSNCQKLKMSLKAK